MIELVYAVVQAATVLDVAVRVFWAVVAVGALLIVAGVAGIVAGRRADAEVES